MIELLSSWIGITGIVLIFFMIVAPTVLLKHVIKKSEKNRSSEGLSD